MESLNQYLHKSSEYLDNKYENIGYIKKKNVLKILNAEYVIFLSDKFFSKFTKHKVLKYFDKYDILYLNYHKKDEVLEILNLINIEATKKYGVDPR